MASPEMPVARSFLGRALGSIQKLAMTSANVVWFMVAVWLAQSMWQTYKERQSQLSKAPGGNPKLPPRKAGKAAVAATASTGASTAGGGAGAPAAAEEEESGEPALDTEAHKKQVETVLARAQQHAAKLGDNKLTIEHMVLALADNPRFGEILQCAEGLSEQDFKKAIKKSRVIYNHPDISTEEEIIEVPPTALAKYGRDLTAAARARKLDPVIGRADELRRLINILSRRTKNNPVILGEPGVGKTALVEGLAQRIAASDVPDSLRSAVVIALDMGQLMAGALFPGEFEQRMSTVLKELSELGSCILFIDDIHTVTGPNAQQGGGVMDASILLKPLLSRGELRCIGCTSLDKFRKFIEKDPQLERRFQQLPLSPPNVAETVSILRGLRTRYERHHGVRISDAALVAAASLSDRYLADRHLPDKAIDLVDEATARVKMESALKPEALDRLERRIADLQKERRLLRRGAGLERHDATALAELDAELETLTKSRSDLASRFEVERGEAAELNTVQDAIDRLADELEELDQTEDDALAAAHAASTTSATPSTTATSGTTSGLNPTSSSLSSSAAPAAKPSASSAAGAVTGEVAAMLAGAAGVDTAGATAIASDAATDKKKSGKKRKGVAPAGLDSLAHADAAAAAAAAADGLPPPPPTVKTLTADEIAALRTDLLARLEVQQAQAKSLRAMLAKAKSGTSMLGGSRNEVSEADVARIISNWTGIPLTKLVESERDKLLTLGDELHKRIIGQGEAVDAVAEAIHRSRAGMKDPNGPIASFIFLGPTGVGKTELAKALASYLFNSEEAMVRLDMSEYMEKHAVSKLIGAPPGYVGFDEGGQLTEALRRRPYTVVLFDEVEKAHVDVFNLLLQVLDDGRVTDSQGRTVSFKNAIIIMTSNLGSQEIYRASAHAGGTDLSRNTAVRTLVMDQVRKHFPPEFVNRVDEFIIFEPLQRAQIAQIVALRTRGVVGRLAEKKMRLVMEERALAYLAARGFDPVFGARPVKRAIQRELETPLAQALLRGEFQEDDIILVTATTAGDRLIFKRVRGAVTEAAGPSREGAAPLRGAPDARMTAANAAAGAGAPALPARPKAKAAKSPSAAAAAPAADPAPVAVAGGSSNGGSSNGGVDPVADAAPPANGDGGAPGVGTSVAHVDANGDGVEAEGVEVVEVVMPTKRAAADGFDPLAHLAALAESGVDLSADGAEMNRDDFTLPTSEG